MAIRSAIRHFERNGCGCSTGRRSSSSAPAHGRGPSRSLRKGRDSCPPPSASTSDRHATMKQRPLGNTSYRVSEIGFGGWGIGGEMWRGVDDSEGRKALREAIEQGITFFDTALAYGNGHSEQVIGEELKHEIRSGHATVATKIPQMNRQWPGKSSYKLGDVFPAKDIASCTEQALSIIARVRFDEGALTGKIKATPVSPAGDWRAEYFVGDRKAEAERRGKALALVLDEQVETLPELALRFCLSSPEVSTVIPGMRRPAHVRQNAMAATKGALPAGMLSKLKPHAWDKNWYS